jgi:D-cysteine desulfhydrase family pyridoxal phosphate-dependent enzyme
VHCVRTLSGERARGSVPVVHPPRLPLAVAPTPLQPAERLGKALGFEPGALWVKRDDLTGLAGGGNKARKLEYLLGDALAQDCDVVVTAGAAQSNHVRTTAGGAAAAGLDCVAVVGGTRPPQPEGNLILDRLLGAELVWVAAYDAPAVECLLAETCLRLASEGRRPYEIPLGGANAVGTLGYVRAAAEIASHAPLGAIVYTAVGTGGTLAGLAVGLGHHDRVRGVDVGALDDAAHRIGELIPPVSALAHRPMPAGRLHVDRSQVGDGYGAPSEAAREAIELAARTEGLLLDPVYTAKALAGLIADRRSGALGAHQPTVFLHTGGLPALFTERAVRWLTPS